jgi:alpha-glucosidase (family GH31 glycosyl hydrolase)
MNYVGERATDPLTFEIYPDAQGNARTSLYEDDGVSPAYRNGVERRTNVTYHASQIDVSATGSYQPGPRKMHFVVHPDDGRPHKVQIH